MIQYFSWGLPSSARIPAAILGMNAYVHSSGDAAVPSSFRIPPRCYLRDGKRVSSNFGGPISA
jgi:hypothetical protein